MRWQQGRRSSNVEDRRGMGGTAMKLGGGSGCILVVVVLVMLAMGKDPSALIGMATGGSGPSAATGPVESTPEEDQQVEFVRAVLGDTEITWNQIFQQRGANYREPKLVVFRNSVRSACGFNSAAVGPFYCPPDQQVYIDLSFFDELERRFGAPGDFARAYVIGHEIGHHVQNLLGISDQVQAQRQRMPRAQANELSVRQELQADCYAGVWAKQAHAQRQMLEPGDIDEGLRAAAAIGDDTIQKRSQGRVSPESWTHGSSEMRVRWFRTGFESGNIDSCDTFDAARL